MHVVLALPGDVDVLPFLVELWRARVASGPLGDYYEPAPVVVAVEPSSFMADVGCVHQAVRLWSGCARQAASPQRRALASWYWGDYYGERRNEITLTGMSLDAPAIRSALDAALLADAELPLGQEGWTAVPYPLLGSAGTR